MRWFGRKAEEREVTPQPFAFPQADEGWLNPRRAYPGPQAAARTGAAEMCAGWWSRALAAAEVSGDSSGTVTAPMLAQAGRAMIRQGEALYLIETRRGRLVLIPASAYWGEGDEDPETWGYRLTLNGPQSSKVVRAPAEQVVHIRWAAEPSRPWRGVSPLELGSQTARRAWASESRLADLAAAPVGQMAYFTTDRDRLTDPQRQRFLDVMAERMAGGDAVPTILEAGIKSGSVDNGLAADPADVENARDVLATLAAACGIPLPLVTGSASAGSAGQREAYRTFLFGAVLPVSKLVAHELRSKLDAPALALGFEELRAADITGRARAYRSLTDAGYPPAQAAAECGLPAPEGPPAPQVPPEAPGPEDSPGTGQGG